MRREDYAVSGESFEEVLSNVANLHSSTATSTEEDATSDALKHNLFLLRQRFIDKFQIHPAVAVPTYDGASILDSEKLRNRGRPELEYAVVVNHVDLYYTRKGEDGEEKPFKITPCEPVVLTLVKLIYGEVEIDDSTSDRLLIVGTLQGGIFSPEEKEQLGISDEQKLVEVFMVYEEEALRQFNIPRAYN